VKKIGPRATHLSALALFWLCSSTAVSAQDIAAKVDEYMNAGLKLGRFSSAVLIARDDKVLVSNGYGVANYEEDSPILPFTKFRIASVTKQFTAMAILILQERGKLKVEDPVCKYVEDCPAAWEPITIHNLLTHTSGIPDYAGLPDFDKLRKLPASASSIIARFKDKPLNFKPGQEFRYSNSNYALLGHVIERLSGKSYQAFLQETIFDPLKMTNSGYDEARKILKRRALGYLRQGDKLTNVECVDMSVPYAAGGLYSTVEDLYLWTQALSTGKLVSEKTLAAMATPFRNNYAYGLTVKEEFGRKLISHGGVIEGFTSFVGRYSNEKVTIIVLNNTIGTSMPAENIARDLAAIVLGEKYEVLGEHKEIKLDPKIYDAYVGEYEVQPGRVYIITKKDDRLFYKFFDKPPFEMRPEAENRFFIKEIELGFTFVKNENGKVTHLILHAPTGQNLQAKKTK
jgi:CubicO group peptidase (beta-lactamase class C family)